MKLQKLFLIPLTLIFLVSLTSVISANSVAIWLFYDSTNSDSTEIMDRDSIGLIVSADSVFEGMTIEVDLRDSSGGFIKRILYVQTTKDSYYKSLTITKEVYSKSGDYIIKGTVTGSSTGNTDTKELYLKVKSSEPENNPPVIISTPITEFNENEFYTYDVEASDADGDTLTYSLIQRPSWLSINPNTGLISGIAPEVDEDTDFDIMIRVSDGRGAFAIQSYTLTVKNIAGPQENHAPIIISGPVTQVDEQEFYRYDVRAFDPDGDHPLRYSLRIAPDWLSINSQTSLIYGIAPKVDEDTVFRVIVRVSDGRGGTDSQFYFLTVRDVAESENLPPVITSRPITEVNESQDYFYQVTAFDPEGDSLIYSFIQRPSWLSIDSQTGLISGTAPEVDEDTDFDIMIRVSDGGGAFAIQSYTLTVKDIIGSEEEKSKKSSKGGRIGMREIPEDEFYQSLYLNQFEKVFGIAIEGAQPEEKPGMIERLLIWIIFLILLMLAIITTVHLIRKIKQ